MAWKLYLTDEVNACLTALATSDRESYAGRGRDRSPGRSRTQPGPASVDRIKGSTLHNPKELRPGSAGAGELRVLFTFDRWRSAILLVAGDKSGNWKGWYSEAIPRAEELYARYLQDRTDEERTR